LDTKEYIASGIIDSYVLGAVSEQERQEVQCMSKIYPEIREELRRAEEALEGYASSVAVTPPERLKNKILERIKETPQEDSTPVVSIAKRPEEAQVNKPIIPLYYKWGAAASILLIVTFGVLYLNTARETQRMSNTLATIQEKSKENEATLASRVNQLQMAMATYKEREDFISSPQTQKLVLEGTANRPEANATVYFDTEKGAALLASTGLPQPEEGKQFQLWVISEGNPISLGVLDKNEPFTSEIALSTKQLDAFAITLEPEGGSNTPTLDQLYVIANV
jgi:anti-sigma-K factor RskA